MSDYINILSGKVALPDHMDCSLNTFARRIAVAIDREMEGDRPDNALIALLCDAARLGWEQCSAVEHKRAGEPRETIERMEAVCNAALALLAQYHEIPPHMVPLATAVNALDKAPAAPEGGE